MTIDVEKFLIEMGLDYYEDNKRFMVCCPFHNDSEPSCGLWKDSGYFECFACHEKGSLVEFVAKVENIPIFQAVRRVRGQTKLSDLQDTLSRMLDRQEEVFKYYSVPSFLKAFPAVAKDSPGWDYLIGRGITPESISRFRIRWGGETGKYRNRVILPIFTPDGKLVAYAGRTVLEGAKPKTKKSRSPHRTFYGIRELLSWCPNPEVFVLVEGEFDAMYLQQFRIPALSNMGTAPVGPEKVLFIRRYVKKVVLAYDPDDAGESAMYGVHGVEGKKDREGEVTRLSRHVPTISVRLLEGKDPNEMSESEVLKVFGKWRVPCLIS